MFGTGQHHRCITREGNPYLVSLSLQGIETLGRGVLTRYSSELVIITLRSALGNSNLLGRSRKDVSIWLRLTTLDLEAPMNTVGGYSTLVE